MKGFNLLEMLGVLFLSSIVLGLAVPTYQRLHEQQAQATELARIMAIINRAKLLANLSATDLTLCHLQASSSAPETSPKPATGSCGTQVNGQGDLLLITSATQTPVQIFYGLGYPWAFLYNNQLEFKTGATHQGTNNSLLPCTGFKYTQPKAVTLNSTANPRINTAPATSLIDQCNK